MSPKVERPGYECGCAIVEEPVEPDLAKRLDADGPWIVTRCPTHGAPMNASAVTDLFMPDVEGDCDA